MVPLWSIFGRIWVVKQQVQPLNIERISPMPGAVAPSGCAARGASLRLIRTTIPVMLIALVGCASAAPSAWAQAPDLYPPAIAWGQPVTLELEDVSVRVAVQTVADLAGLSVVVPAQVSGKVSLQLRGVPWPHALQAIARAAKVEIHQTDGVYWVVPANARPVAGAGDAKAVHQDTVKSAVAAPIEARVFKLNHAEAPEVLRQLQAVSSDAKRNAPSATNSADSDASARLIETPSMWADARSNQLFVSDTASRIGLMAQWVAALDVPLRQVVIEAKIVEADQNFSRQLGVRLGSGRTSPLMWGDHVGVGPSYEAVSAEGVGAALPFVSLPAAGVNGYPAASFAVSLFGAGVGRFLNLEISALEADGRGKLISSPHVVTTDRVKALIQQGTEYPYQTTNSSGQVSVEFRKASLKLEVTPRIAPNGFVMLNLVVHKDSRGETTASGIAINTKQVQTQVLVEDGGTLVIGGILEEYEREEVTRVPVLGELPVVGNVFKSTSKRTDKTEIVVFITPRVIENH